MRNGVLAFIVTVSTGHVGCLAPEAAGAAEGRQVRYARVQVPPVDEALTDVHLSTFREVLLAAVENRNPITIVQSVDPTLMNGSETVRSELDASLAVPDHSYWSALERSLKLGGSFTTTRGARPGRREFCAPYTYSRYPKPVPEGFHAELDPWVVIGRQVPVRTEPNETSTVIARLTHELVEVNGAELPGVDPKWYGVVTAEGREGWISSSAVRDPTDYHVCLAQINGQWMISDIRQGTPF